MAIKDNNSQPKVLEECNKLSPIISYLQNNNSSFMGQIEAQIRIAIKKINLNDSQVIELKLFPSLIILEKTGNNKPANK